MCCTCLRYRVVKHKVAFINWGGHMSKLSAVQNKIIEEYWSSLDDLKKQLRYREWELLNAQRNRYKYW